MVKIIYSRKYNIGFYGLERLHPFDSKKYGRAWRYLRAKLGRRLKQLAIKTDRSANLEELLFIHDFAYLKQLRSSRYVAAGKCSASVCCSRGGYNTSEVTATMSAGLRIPASTSR